MKITLGWYDDIIRDNSDANWDDAMEEEDECIVVILCGDEKTEGYVAPDLTREEEEVVQGVIIHHKEKALRHVLLHTI